MTQTLNMTGKKWNQLFYNLVLLVMFLLSNTSNAFQTPLLQLPTTTKKQTQLNVWYIPGPTSTIPSKASWYSEYYPTKSGKVTYDDYPVYEEPFAFLAISNNWPTGNEQQQQQQFSLPETMGREKRRFGLQIRKRLNVVRRRWRQVTTTTTTTTEP